MEIGETITRRVYEPIETTEEVTIEEIPAEVPQEEPLVTTGS